MDVSGFVPEDVQADGYRRLPSISFRDLMIGVKKIPEGTNAGDLTRALLFALENDYDYRFPDDLPTILDHIGRTHITTAHTDRLIVRRYSDLKRLEDGANRLPRQNHSRNFNSQPSEDQTQGSLKGPLGEIATSSQMGGPSTPQNQQMLQYGTQSFSAIQPTMAMRSEEAVDSQMHAAHVVRSDEVMDDLPRPYLDKDLVQVPTTPSYDSHNLPRDCIEGNVAFDESPFARAARFAQRPDQVENAWRVEHVTWLNQLLEAVWLESFN